MWPKSYRYGYIKVLAQAELQDCDIEIYFHLDGYCLDDNVVKRAITLVFTKPIPEC